MQVAVWVLAAVSFIVMIVAILVFANVITPSLNNKQEEVEEALIEFAPNVALDGEPIPTPTPITTRWEIDQGVVPYVNGSIPPVQVGRLAPFSTYVNSSINEINIPFTRTNNNTLHYDIDADGNLQNYTQVNMPSGGIATQLAIGDGYTVNFTNAATYQGPTQCHCYFASTKSAAQTIDIPVLVEYIYAIATFNDLCFVLCVTPTKQYVVYQLEINTDNETATFAPHYATLVGANRTLYDRHYGQFSVTDTEYCIAYNWQLRTYDRVDVSVGNATAQILQQIDALVTSPDPNNNPYIPMSFGISADALTLLVTWVPHFALPSTYPSTTVDLYSRIDTSYPFELKEDNILPSTSNGTYYAAQFIQNHYAIVMFAQNPDRVGPDPSNYWLPTILFLIDAQKDRLQSIITDQIAVDLPKLLRFDISENPASDYMLAPLNNLHRFRYDSYSTGTYLVEQGNRIVLFLSCGYTTTGVILASTVSLQLKKG